MATLAESIEQFAKTPPKTKLAAAGLLTAFFGAIFYFVFYSDLSDEDTRLERDIVRLEQEKRKYEDRKQRYRAFRAEVNQLLEKQKELLKVLPDDANISSFLESIHAQAELAGVSILTYDPRREVRRNFYAQIPVRMTISGSYHQIQKFFYYMERDVKRIVKIDGLSLSAPKRVAAGMVLKANFSASTFRFIGKRPG